MKTSRKPGDKTTYGLDKNLGTVQELLTVFSKSSDFKTRPVHLSASQQIVASFFNTLVDEEKLHHDLFRPLQQHEPKTQIKSVKDIVPLLPLDNIEITDHVETIHRKLLQGCLILRMSDADHTCAVVHIASKLGLRKSNDTENEFSVVGPKVGFIEDLDTNIHLLRLKINIPNLVVKEFMIGNISNSRVAIMYIDGVTNEQVIQTVKQRIEDIDFEVVFDTSQLDQMLSDNSNSPFPLFLTTERRDRVVYALVSGQIAVISDGSPYFVTGPSTLFDFFISPEDYYLPWVLGSFFRLIRIFGVVFSLFASSLYIATLTFHFEVVPHNLLGPLIYSRINVPFPPILEVLFLELTIEFLREAGARLPTKIGQTLGIVGGIIVGQAAVEAALTSNILIIVVSLSALASFTTPIFKMSNTIRFLRFPIIILASIWGGLGILIGICFLLVHLTRLKSLGFPYTVPLFPFRLKDLKDSFIRPPYPVIDVRPDYLRTKEKTRYTSNDKRKNKKKREWDEG
ncbi:spore germination protein [Paenibacillus gansuensis]|uniref:Spore germination protein n=1 Tax=Paenibacillus gansuensis TaxID=306542 RepID=A0ABW5PIW5_9BACL